MVCFPGSLCVLSQWVTFLVVLGGGWVVWEREIRIKEVFIGWVGQGRALPNRTLQR